MHTIGNYRDGHSYICNCCTCSCGVLRGVVEFSIPSAVAHSAFRAAVDIETCIGCGTCIERCQFGALAVSDEVCIVAPVRCVGCGLCAAACASGALRLERRADSGPLPGTLKEWMLRRAEERGIHIEDIV